MRRVLVSGALLIACAICEVPSAGAQTVTQKLSNLLTDQTPPPPGYVRDKVAAEATFVTVASLLKVELTNVPVVSSSGGFAYRFNPKVASGERVSESFGPFFTERAMRNGEGQFSVGVGIQSTTFDSLQGAKLGNGSFPTNTARFANQLQLLSVDTLTLTIDMTSVLLYGTYGVTDRLDVGGVIPFTTLTFSGRRVNAFQGQSVLQSAQSGSARGLGDMTATARYRLLGRSASGVAAGVDLRLPTGNEAELLGAGKTAWRFLGIGSWEMRRLATHVNGGFGLGGVSREQFLNAAVTWALQPKVSLVGEVMSRRLSELTRVDAVYEPHPVLAGVETMRWLPADRGLFTNYLVTGFKWNVGGNWLLNGQILTQLTDTGLRGRVTPSIAIDRSLNF